MVEPCCHASRPVRGAGRVKGRVAKGTGPPLGAWCSARPVAIAAPKLHGPLGTCVLLNTDPSGSKEPLGLALARGLAAFSGSRSSCRIARILGL